MTEPIDHAQRARDLADGAIETLKATLEEHLNPTGATAEAHGIVHASLANAFAAASVEATLALAQAQDRANELQEQAIEQQKVANLFEHEHMRMVRNAHYNSNLHGPSAVWITPKTEHGDFTLAPSIAASLGLGGESDGE